MLKTAPGAGRRSRHGDGVNQICRTASLADGRRCHFDVDFIRRRRSDKRLGDINHDIDRRFLEASRIDAGNGRS